MNINRNEAKTMVKHISCDCNGKFNGTTYNLNQEWNIEICQCQYENDHTFKKVIVGILGYVSKNSKYLKFIGDDSKILCN